MYSNDTVCHIQKNNNNNFTLMALYTCTKDIKIYIKQNNFTPMVQYTMYKRHEQNNFTPMVQYTMYKRHEQNNFTPMVCIPCTKDLNKIIVL